MPSNELEPQAGWYPDPYGGSGLRWHDGAEWTTNVVQPQTPAPQPASVTAKKRRRWPLVVGGVAAFLVFVGAISPSHQESKASQASASAHSSAAPTTTSAPVDPLKSKWMAMDYPPGSTLAWEKGSGEFWVVPLSLDDTRAYLKAHLPYGTGPYGGREAAFGNRSIWCREDSVPVDEGGTPGEMVWWWTRDLVTDEAVSINTFTDPDDPGKTDVIVVFGTAKVWDTAIGEWVGAHQLVRFCLGPDVPPVMNAAMKGNY